MIFYLQEYAFFLEKMRKHHCGQLLISFNLGYRYWIGSSLRSTDGKPRLKDLSFCHKLWSFNPCISATRSCRSLTFQTKNSDRSNILSLKYKRFTASGCKDKVIRKLEFVTKAQLFSHRFNLLIKSLINF